MEIVLGSSFTHRFPYPIGIAPTAFQRLAHPDGELATVRGGILNI
jgi:isopentenyl diphosphate isomerase/L-lactate dehydrogenase-like FMN-dependent dehydrogenase